MLRDFKSLLLSDSHEICEEYYSVDCVDLVDCIIVVVAVMSHTASVELLATTDMNFLMYHPKIAQKL